MPTARRAPNAHDLDRVVAVFEGLMQRVMASHAPELNTLDLTMSQTKAMYLLIAHRPMRMSELAQRLGVTNSTATGTVDRLVELGLTVRAEDPADRRQVVVAPTDRAREVLEHFRELNSHRMREMLARIDASDLSTVEAALRILDAALASEPTGPTATVTPPPTAASHHKGTRS